MSESSGNGLLERVFPGDGEMAQLCRGFDWASTSLGAVETWSISLRTTVATMITARHPMILFWGDDRNQLYNDAYIPALGGADRHPVLLGKRAIDSWPGEVWNIVGPQIDSVIQSGIATWHEDQYVPLPRFGQVEETYWTYSYAPAYDDHGVRGVLVITLETTGRVLAERENARLLAELRTERELLQAVVLGAPAPVALHVGPEQRFAMLNDAFKRISGERDVTGMTPQEAYPEMIGKGILERIQEVFETGTSFSYAEAYAHYDRRGHGLEDSWFDLRYEPIRDASGSIRGVLNFSFDVTAQVLARRQIEELLAQSERARLAAEDAQREAHSARAEAQAASHAKSEFLATMSHEIRTPINAITGYAQLLDLGIAGPITETQRDYLGRLDAAGQHLLGLVNDVLDLAKIDAGEVTVAREIGETNAVVVAALDLVRPQGAARGIELVDGNPDESIRFVGDTHRVRQILVNLLSNAVKFTESGGSITLTCSLETTPPPHPQSGGTGWWACIRVADNGIGIAPQHHADIFEPFHQVDQGRTRVRGGTGLGLTISRRLARLMGGDLTVESALGVGSTFTLWVPAATVSGVDEGQSPRVVDRATSRTARGLSDVGGLVRRQMDAIVTTYVQQLRIDPALPNAPHMRAVDLEDHVATGLADLAQTLCILGDVESSAVTGLITDSVAINATVADRHGSRRFAQGWDLAALRRDYTILRQILTRVVQQDADAHGADADAALNVLLEMIARAEARGVMAWNAASDRDGVE